MAWKWLTDETGICSPSEKCRTNGGRTLQPAKQLFLSYRPLSTTLSSQNVPQEIFTLHCGDCTSRGIRIDGFGQQLVTRPLHQNNGDRQLAKFTLYLQCLGDLWLNRTWSSHLLNTSLTRHAAAIILACLTEART
eukprot:6210772-Amphidinium_carterae.1